MVGIPVDLFWLVSLDLSMGEKKKGKKSKKSRSHKRKETKTTERLYRPSNPFWDWP